MLLKLESDEISVSKYFLTECDSSGAKMKTPIDKVLMWDDPMGYLRAT